MRFKGDWTEERVNGVGVAHRGIGHNHFAFPELRAPRLRPYQHGSIVFPCIHGSEIRRRRGSPVTGPPRYAAAAIKSTLQPNLLSHAFALSLSPFAYPLSPPNPPLLGPEPDA